QGRGAAVSFFVLDACRDNPLAAAGVRSIGGTRGLTRMDTPKGVFVLFSAGLGQTALDRLGDDDPNPNSVFTRSLVPLLKAPGMTHVALAKRVQRDVDELAATVHHAQQPAYYDQIIGEIVRE
ncbi:MAG TPA: caspase family protein, partial [Methyloceanibacter sp.]|nr:caspase family protein [Methyloceanibacter sp.]